MNQLDFYSIVNSRLLTVVLSFNILFVLILYITSDFPQNIGSILVEHLSYQSLEEANHSVTPALTEHPVVYDPPPEWLVSVLNADDLPCESLPSPTSGQRHGYSYPPWDASDYRALRSRYLPFQSQQRRGLAPSIRSELDLAKSCVDVSVANGTLCGSATGTVPKLDVVWTFTNGSGVLHEKWRKVRQVQQELERSGALAPRAARLRTRRTMAGTEKKLFRDHDELRHSMRSVLQHFRPFTSQFHLITSDFEFPSCNPDEYAGWRLGQIPQWLDLSRPYEWTDGRIELNVVPHANLFNKYYKYTTFNSLAIESQFANLNVSDAFIYLNDDFYFAADLSPWDFHTPSFGLVLRMQPDLLVSSLEDDAVPSEGEWHSLEFSNRLLSDRFGLRRRPYVIHEAKALKRSLISEISLIWSTELAETSSHPFRTDPLLKDAHMGFIAAHFVVERWREGLLWSWIVARVGRANDEWDSTALAQAWFELGGTHETPDMTLWVPIPERDSLSRERMSEAQALVPGAQSRHSTTYAFTSQDGYPYTFLGDQGSNQWPQFPAPHKRCSIEFEKCFPSGMTSASAMFKHVAFVEPGCGDCIINALVTSSGRLGLSAFLPPVSHTPEPLQDWSESSTPHLPLVSDYRSADFSLRAVVGDSTDVRSWTVNMLQRYRFVIGDTPSIFAMVRDALSARTPFESMDADPSVALLCLNDDITDQPEESDDILRQEQQKRWPHRASWEIRE